MALRFLLCHCIIKGLCKNVLEERKKLMTPQLLKRIKSYLQLIIATLIISAVLVYVTCYVNHCSLLQVFMLQETTVITCIAIAANVKKPAET